MKIKNIAVISLASIFFGVGVAIANGYTFGYPGQDGRNGYSGQNGRDGRNVTLRATGQSENLDLRGEDGSQGYDGDNGYDATSCWHGQPDYNLQGAAGGDAGDGGSGGSGGDGGDVIAYYDNVNNLKNVIIDSTPGRGSYGGDGGRYAGNGCRCQYSSWVNRICETHYHTVTVCTPTGCAAGSQGCSCKQEQHSYQVCNDYRFYCSDGRDGQHGRRGPNGTNGSYGKLRLIPRLQELEPTTESTRLAVPNILSGTTTLDRHDWEQRSGATSLFSSSSRIRDNYSVWVGKTVKTISFNWQDMKRPPSYFPASSLFLELNNQNISVVPSSDFWHTFSEEVSGNHKTYTVKNAIRSSEVANVKVVEVEGKLEDLNLILEDLSDVSDLVKTRIEVETDWDLLTGGDFKGWLPDELISVQGNKIYVRFGGVQGLKPKEFAKYLGEKFELKLIIHRYFANKEKVVQEGRPVFKLKKDLKKMKPLEIKMDDEF